MRSAAICPILIVLVAGAAFCDVPAGDAAAETAVADEQAAPQGLPTSLEQFRQQIAEKATDPKGAVKLWFDAVFVFLLRDKELGRQMILEMDRYKEWDSRTFLTFRRQMEQTPYIMFSYAKAATPENGYEFDPDNYELTFHGDVNTKPFVDRDEGQFVKVFVRSNGADMPRPITLQRNMRGEYKFYEFSSIFVGVKPPVEPKIWGESVPESADPVWTVRHWLQGILLYHAGEKEQGLAQMNSVMKEPTDARFHRFSGSAMGADKTHIWRSYVKGATPDNQYKVDDIPGMEIETYYQRNEAPTEASTSVRMFVRSSGADSARPIRLERDDRGEWRVSEFSSLCVGVRPPKDPQADDF